MAGGWPRPALLGAAALLLGVVPWCAGQSVYFEVLGFREPGQCERHQCMSARVDRCRDHRVGYFLREKGCTNGQICTRCTYPAANSSDPTTCECENPPYSTSADYNQECNIGTVCSVGECYRPCDTFLHSTLCPTGHCEWDTTTEACIPKIPAVGVYMWTASSSGSAYLEQGAQIVQNTPTSFYPIGFEYFKAAGEGYRINGVLVNNITSFETMFALLDTDGSGGLNSGEFAGLPAMLQKLAGTTRRLQDEDESPEEAERRLTTAQACGAQGRFYCSFDGDCKEDCAVCGWKSAHDRAFSTCVVPSATVCHADQQRVFCPTDELCKVGDCSDCPGRPRVDFSQHTCLATWWGEQPLSTWSNWVCRYRHKVGMSCVHDQDCIHGLRRCMDESGGRKCQPLVPYDADGAECTSDDDCSHIGYYCPSDPTNGLNQYWVQYCRAQKGEGEYCEQSGDRECQPELRCNTVETTPTCRRYFSLPIGTLASADELCEFGWRDRDGRCATAARSKNAGGACDTDADCVTTDATGRTGKCVCKAWWQDSDSRYCEPVAGDYRNHLESFRNYLWFQVRNCGNHWTEEECLEEIGAEAQRRKYEFDCEKQRLVNGPFLPPSDCNIAAGDARFVDSCARLDALGR